MTEKIYEGGSKIILEGKDAIVIPVLAIVGGVTIGIVVGLGVYKVAETGFSELEKLRKGKKSKGEA